MFCDFFFLWRKFVSFSSQKNKVVLSFYFCLKQLIYIKKNKKDFVVRIKESHLFALLCDGSSFCKRKKKSRKYEKKTKKNHRKVLIASEE